MQKQEEENVIIHERIYHLENEVIVRKDEIIQDLKETETDLERKLED